MSINVSPVFFDWQGVAPKFFAMIHNALSKDIHIDPGDFNALASNNLGEVVARYNVFGGSKNVALYADRISMDFPNLAPEDSGMVQNIVGKIVSAFRQTFPDHNYASVQASMHSHGTIPDDMAVTDYLAQYAILRSGNAFGDAGMGVLPGARFDVLAPDHTWRATCTLEQSQRFNNGLYAGIYMDFFSVDEGHDFGYWLDRLVSVWEGSMGVLDLEW